MRARGVDISDTPEQPQEASLLRAMTIQDIRGNTSFRSESVQEASSSSKGHPMLPEELKKKSTLKTAAETNAQSESKNVGCTANTYLGAQQKRKQQKCFTIPETNAQSESKNVGCTANKYLGAQQKRKQQKCFTSRDQSRKTIKNNQNNKQVNLMKNGIINAENLCVIERSRDSASQHMKRKYICHREINKEVKRSQSLLSMINMVISVQRKGWQRKLFCLLSRGLQNNDLNSCLQHGPPQTTSKNYMLSNACLQHGQCQPTSKGYTLSNACTVKINGTSTNILSLHSPKRKRKRAQSSESLTKPHKIRASMEQCKPPFNDFFKKVLEITPSQLPKLDWNNLPSERPTNNEESTPRVDVSYNESPFVRKRHRNKYRPRNPIAKTKRCAVDLGISSVWNDQGWSFDELFRLRDDNQNPDWTLIPLKSKAPKVSWDPIIFHVAAKNIDDHKNEQGSPLEYLWKDMELGLNKDQFSDIMVS